MATATHESSLVYWLPTVASIAAPTAANITAGTNLSAQVPVGGIDLSSTQSKASLAMLGDAFIKEGIGTYGKSMTITFTRDAASSVLDVAWTLFTYKLAGHIMISRFGSVAVAARVEVYQVECGKSGALPSAENQIQQFTNEFAIQKFDDKAVVAA